MSLMLTRITKTTSTTRLGGGGGGQNCYQCLVITLAAIALIKFVLLQARFMKLMNEKAALIERIQELEHVTVQLSMETETIGKY